MANNESKYEKVPKKTEDETAFIDTEDINKTEGSFEEPKRKGKTRQCVKRPQYKSQKNQIVVKTQINVLNLPMNPPMGNLISTRTNRV